MIIKTELYSKLDAGPKGSFAKLDAGNIGKWI